MPPALIAAMTPGTTFRDCDVCPEMVVIPAGNFTMGSPASEAARRDDEGPQHQVRISRPFAAGKYEVTFDDWDACVREGGCGYKPDDFPWGRGRRPVFNVSWQDANKYAEWLSRKTGKNYRLLTEAEWEYVARAGTTTAFSFGNRITPTQANYDARVSYAGSPTRARGLGLLPVGSNAPNNFGLHDVHGNVSEWTEDCYHSNYNGAPSDGSAWISGDCGRRVRRGGALNVGPSALRSASRSDAPLDLRYPEIGFRVARSDSEAKPFSPIGSWKGLIKSKITGAAGNADVQISANGSFVYRTTFGSELVGTLRQTDNIIVGVGTIKRPEEYRGQRVPPFPDGTREATITFNGQFSSETKIEGTFSGGGESGTFEFSKQE